MTFVCLFFPFKLCLQRNLHFLFQVPAGAMEESSGEDADSNVQDEIKINITNKMFMLLFVFGGGGVKFSVDPPPPPSLKLMLQHSAISDSRFRSLHLPINVIQEV